MPELVAGLDINANPLVLGAVSLGQPTWGALQTAGLVWDVATLSWVRATQASGGGGSVTQGSSPWIEDAQKYAFRLDDSATPVLYIGQAATGSAESNASWRISRLDMTAGLSITWASGSPAFNQIWSNRTGLSYS